MTIGERVKLARKKKGMTQEELANQLGYKSKSSVTHIEKGRDIPRAMVSQLARILDVTPSYLMGWEELDTRFGDIWDFKDDIDIALDEKIALLNDIGKNKALDYISDLTEQSKYIIDENKRIKIERK